MYGIGFPGDLVGNFLALLHLIKKLRLIIEEIVKNFL
jgi:hypothetical protein